MTFRLLAEARQELLEAAEFYEGRGRRLGFDFLDEVRVAIRKACDAPTRWPRIDRNVRRAVVKRFPYSVVYSPEDDEIIVIAIAHAKRAPDYWKDRLE